jgi:hypothetical protein
MENEIVEEACNEFSFLLLPLFFPSVAFFFSLVFRVSVTIIYVYSVHCRIEAVRESGVV